MDNTQQSTPVVRVSIGQFDPANLETVRQMAIATGDYLIPAIKELKGLIHYYAAVSDKGTMTHVSIWENEEAAEQMSRLQLMIVNARQAAEAVGITFIPIVNYPTCWTIEGEQPVA